MIPLKLKKAYNGRFNDLQLGSNNKITDFKNPFSYTELNTSGPKWLRWENEYQAEVKTDSFLIENLD